MYNTHDFVLNPSVDDARPEIMEGIEENEKLVADALVSLVESELPEQQRLSILTECQEIAHGFTDPNRIKSISSKITEALQEKTKPATVVKQDVDQGTHPIQETQTMSANPQAPANQLDANTLQWHQAQIDQAVKQVNESKDKEINGLKDTLIESQSESKELRMKLDAAEKLIEEFQSKVQELQESAPADEDLKKRYDASVELLDEAIVRLPEIGTLTSRCEALEGLLEASINKHQKDRMDECVQRHLEQAPEAIRDTIRPVLEGCETPEQVHEMFEAFTAVASKAPQVVTEPLPTQAINEGKVDPKPAQPATTLVGLMVKRLSEATR